MGEITGGSFHPKSGPLSLGTLPVLPLPTVCIGPAPPISACIFAHSSYSSISSPKNCLSILIPLSSCCGLNCVLSPSPSKFIFWSLTPNTWEGDFICKWGCGRCNLGRSPGGGHGNPLQYSYLENPHGQRSLEATVHRVAQSWTWLKQLSRCN